MRFLGRGENSEYTRLAKVIREKYPEHYAEFIFSLNTGLRLSSQYSATYGMIDWARKVLDLARTKNDEPVQIPLNSDVLAAIRSLPSWRQRKGPIFRNQRHPEKAVLSKITGSSPLRRLRILPILSGTTSATRSLPGSVQDGVPLDRVSKLLGHKSLTMTMRYAHLAPNQLHEDVALLTKNSTPVAPKDVWERSQSAMSLIN